MAQVHHHTQTDTKPAHLSVMLTAVTVGAAVHVCLACAVPRTACHLIFAADASMLCCADEQKQTAVDHWQQQQQQVAGRHPAHNSWQAAIPQLQSSGLDLQHGALQLKQH